MSLAINEYIVFGKFNSKEQGYYLITRDAPTPSEKSVTENLNYMNGVLDFSEVTGERLYSNRTITYTFTKFNVDYSMRKVLENQAKKLLMADYNSRLYDSHDIGYYWLGKCQSVKVTDEADKRELTLQITFDVYPFAYKDSSESNTDDWDSFDLVDGFVQKLDFHIVGNRTLNIFNNGQNRITPTVNCDSPFTITVTVMNGGMEQDITFKFDKNKNHDYLFSLDRGDNILKVNGNGNISFVIKIEEMI